MAGGSCLGIPKRHPSLDEAFALVRWENPHLSPEQARHLTEHGAERNEDDTFSWKFDNYVRARGGPMELHDQFRDLWTKITCPALLIFGAETGMAKLAGDDALDALPTARVEVVSGAGHWPHHDELGAFITILRGFFEPPRSRPADPTPAPEPVDRPPIPAAAALLNGPDEPGSNSFAN